VQHPPTAHRLALPVLLTGTCLIVLDFFIVNVALPSMQLELHASSAALEWVVAGYGLTFAVLLLAAGRLGDRFGRRRTFLAGLALFTLASAGCALAPTAGALIGARLAQGAGGALISPSVLALIGVLYDGPARARAIGTYASVMGVAAAGGQLIGGLLLHADVAGLGWRLVFVINLPLGITAIALTRRCIPESRPAATAAVDVPGLVLVTAAMTALVLPLVDGRDSGWPWWTFACLAAAPLLFLEFALRQRATARRGGAPLVDLALFRTRSFVAGSLTQLLFWSGQASYFLVLALYLQLGRGLSPLRAWLVFSLLAAAYLGTSMRVAALAARFGRRVVITGAGALAAGHLLALGVVAGSGTSGPVLLLAPSLLLAGAGMGLCLAPITATVLSAAQPQQAGAVSGLLSATQQVGNAVGVAAVGLVFFGTVDRGYAFAFEVSVALLAVVLASAAVCARQLPSHR
jgi:MFS family permease